jgi:spore maturation protein CgeB
MRYDSIKASFVPVFYPREINMKIVIFGLTMSSSWGNGHATLWRGLSKALVRRGHEFIFFEKDVPYYASHRDFGGIPGANLYLYPDWQGVLPLAKKHLEDADIGMVTSYCADAIAASVLVLSSNAKARAFYDLDTPVTLDRLEKGMPVEYIGKRGLGDFDLVLSFTGGRSLRALQKKLGAKRVYPLYGSVDPEAHCPVKPVDSYKADMSYLGTYAEDRQEALEELFLEPARRLPEKKFLVGGSLYPEDFLIKTASITPNIHFVRHVSPPEHPAFYCSSKLSLNITRRPMKEMGYCPSGRLFEAAACGAPVISDYWEGLEEFFEPGSEILIGKRALDSINALETDEREIRKIARRARERTLEEHTAERRALQLEEIIQDAFAYTGEK